jgi:hypothetical protein
MYANLTTRFIKFLYLSLGGRYDFLQDNFSLLNLNFPQIRN